MKITVSVRAKVVSWKLINSSSWFLPGGNKQTKNFLYSVQQRESLKAANEKKVMPW